MTDSHGYGKLFLGGALIAASLCAPSAASARPIGGTAANQPIEVLSAQQKPLQGMPKKAGEQPVRLAEADCSGAAAEAAAETGGQVLSVSSRQQGGRTVCVVTLLVPGEAGGRPSKRTVSIPQ